jgi:ubiquinone/menaquinone biosynthesis C-methylase UbiE
MSNLEIYDDVNFVERYSHRDFLYLAEKKLIELFRLRMQEWSMLDIGVGAGRTTPYFAPLVKEYIGIDYSKNMIKKCLKKFAGRYENAKFEIVDAKNMAIFDNNCFDLCLFSHNGLDSIPCHEDRIVILKEIRRITKKGGYLFFSSHNILCLDNLFKFKFARNPIRFLHYINNYFKLRTHNKNWNKLKQMPYALISDGAHNFKFLLYYVHPLEQIRQLEYVGFKDVQIYLNTTGEKFMNKHFYALNKEGWLNYLCEA